MSIFVKEQPNLSTAYGVTDVIILEEESELFNIKRQGSTNKVKNTTNRFGKTLLRDKKQIATPPQEF